MYLLSSIVILTFLSVACDACCIGYDPVFENNPSFEYIGSTVIKVSWDKVKRNMGCADRFEIAYWETDRKESTKLTKTLNDNNVRSYNIPVREGVAYSFAVNAIEESIGQCKSCSWACAIGGSVCCVGNGWSGDISVPAPTIAYIKSCDNCWCGEGDRHYIGNGHHASLEDCKRICSKDENCKGIEHWPGGAMNCYRCSNPVQTSAYTHWNANGIPSVYKKEVVSCIDKDTCSSVTTGQCSAFPSIRANCPVKCDVEQCRRKKCEDTPECDIEPSLCGMLSNDDKYKCNQTCGLCEDVNIQAFRFAHGNVYNWISETEKVFQFESKIPYDSSDGIGFKTEVRVQAFADHTLRMKFEGFGYLGEVVLVQLKRGDVKGFFVGRDEPNVVTNIKRSFLSQIALGIPETSHTVLKTQYTGTMIELLRSEAIVARLPLPSKTRRKETSLLPIWDNITSSATEGPVDQIRLCDSDKDCPEGTRCTSHCNRWACVVQCIPLPENNLTSYPGPGNCCEVTEKWWGQALDSCKCDPYGNPDCQLVFDEVEKTITCHKNPSHSCRVAIEAWASAYKNAPNANDACCKYGDPNYKGSQIAWDSCSPEPLNCVDLDACKNVTTDQCSAFSSLRTICPLKCDVEQCRPRKCEDTPECPDGVLPSLCGLLSNEDKYKCNKTCGLCEDVNIQGITDSNDQAMPTNKFRGRIAKRIGEAATWT